MQVVEIIKQGTIVGVVKFYGVPIRTQDGIRIPLDASGQPEAQAIRCEPLGTLTQEQAARIAGELSENSAVGAMNDRRWQLDTN